MSMALASDPPWRRNEDISYTQVYERLDRYWKATFKMTQSPSQIEASSWQKALTYGTVPSLA